MWFLVGSRFFIRIEKFLQMFRVEFENKGFYLEYKTDLPDYACGITTRNLQFNYSYHTIKTEEEKKIVDKSRRLLFESLSFRSIVTLRQVHSDKICILDEDNMRDFEDSKVEGDGLITDVENILIGVSTADCIPLIYLSKGKKVCGVVHAGWRGIHKGIHLNMLQHFKRDFGVLMKDVFIIIGAHIRDCCYIVGSEMFEFFPKRYFKNFSGNLYLNLLNIVVDGLTDCGISENNLAYLDICSYCGGDFFYSYRRGEESMRNLSFAGIRQCI
ncbi:MAG: polyphenol oxidase family protein [Brevinematia bacterium]